MKALALILILVTSVLSASSLRLVNDTPYDLSVVIRGNGGMTLGQVKVLKGQSWVWEENYLVDDNFGDKSQLKPMNPYQEGYTQSPYVVTWYILESGETYGTCNNVSSGSYVSAKGCQTYGRQPPKKEQQKGQPAPKAQAAPKAKPAPKGQQ